MLLLYKELNEWVIDHSSEVPRIFTFHPGFFFFGGRGRGGGMILHGLLLARDRDPEYHIF